MCPADCPARVNRDAVFNSHHHRRHMTATTRVHHLPLLAESGLNSSIGCWLRSTSHMIARVVGVSLRCSWDNPMAPTAITTATAAMLPEVMPETAIGSETENQLECDKDL